MKRLTQIINKIKRSIDKGQIIHTHLCKDITDLEDDIALKDHTHVVADITDMNILSEKLSEEEMVSKYLVTSDGANHVTYEFIDDDAIQLTVIQFAYQIIDDKNSTFSHIKEGADVSATFDLNPDKSAVRIMMNLNKVAINQEPPTVQYNIIENMNLDTEHYIRSSIIILTQT